MKNRITELFEKKQKDILNVYFTAGYPKLNDTVTIIELLEKSGADLIEIGMPFSDPLADGPTIQASGDVALNNGMNIKKLFEQLEGIRSKVNVPIVLMGYINPVLQYGFEAFCKKAAEVGVDGLILPDLPHMEFKEFYEPHFRSNNLSNIFLVTPQTSPDRLAKIDADSSGFIYVVSTNSTTGNEARDTEGMVSYFERIQSAGLKNPTLIGFNIKDQVSFERACKYSNGAIIGSAFIKALEASSDLETTITSFVAGIKGEALV